MEKSIKKKSQDHRSLEADLLSLFMIWFPKCISTIGHITLTFLFYKNRIDQTTSHFIG